MKRAYNKPMIQSEAFCLEMQPSLQLDPCLTPSQVYDRNWLGFPKPEENNCFEYCYKPGEEETCAGSPTNLYPLS